MDERIIKVVTEPISDFQKTTPDVFFNQVRNNILKAINEIDPGQRLFPIPQIFYYHVFENDSKIFIEGLEQVFECSWSGLADCLAKISADEIKTSTKYGRNWARKIAHDLMGVPTRYGEDDVLDGLDALSEKYASEVIK